MSLIAACLLMSVPVQAATVYVTAPEGLRVRSIPSVNGSVMQVLDFGTEIAVVDDEPLNGWLRVEGDGYIKAEHTDTANPLDGMEYLGEWRITAYAETGYPCANGNYPMTGYTIACNSLPFGAEVYIEGVGFRTVEDRGPAWLGDAWCDLYLGVHDECVQWGDQRRKVWKVAE